MRFSIVIYMVIILYPTIILANHGPGASGGGSATISGETLKSGSFEFGLREDYSQFEHFDQQGAAAKAATGGDFDALDHAFLTSAELAYGITDDFQIGASLGYFVGRQFVSADRESDGTVSTSTAEPTGLTDLAVIGKYHLLRGQPGNLALVGGAIFPTGRSDVQLENAEPLSPTDQPGTGRWGFPVGVGYSRFLTDHLTIDASILYTLRLERGDFRVGDRLDAGVALAYRLTDSIKKFPQYSLFGELTSVYLYRDREVDGYDPNSGGETIYLTPGARVRFNPHVALTLAPSVPIYQRLNGAQGRVQFKCAVTLSLSF